MYNVENDQELQRHTAESDRLRALTEFLAQAQVFVVPAEFSQRQKLPVDHYAAIEDAFEAVRAIASRSTFPKETDG